MKRYLFTIILGLFIAGVVSAGIASNWKTVDDIIPRTDKAVNIGDASHYVGKAWIATTTVDDMIVNRSFQLGGTVSASDNLTMEDGAWIGLGSTKGRLVFDDTTTDDMSFMNGNVGIGTTSPLALLDAYGNMILSGSNRYLNFATSTGSSGYGFRDNSGTIEFKNLGGSWAGIGSGSGTSYWTLSGSNLYSTSSTENVGIGTTTPDGILSVATSTGDSYFHVGRDGNVGIGTTSPATPLHISDDTATNLLIIEGTGSQNAGVLLKTNKAPRKYDFRTDGDAFEIRSSQIIGTFRLRTSDNDFPFEVLMAAPTGSFYVDDEGNVGIGTTTPDYKLDVYKDGSSGPMFRVSSSTDSDTFIIDEDGNVGIGTTSPDSLFHITDSGMATTTITIGKAQSAGCIKMRAGDDSGWTYFWSATPGAALSTTTAANCGQ